MTELASVLRKDSLYPHPENLIQFFGDHDTSRLLTEANGSIPRLREALGLMATPRGAAQLYSGEEIAMADGEDPDSRRDFPGGFPTDLQPSAFTASTRISVQQATSPALPVYWPPAGVILYFRARGSKTSSPTTPPSSSSALQASPDALPDRRRMPSSA